MATRDCSTLSELKSAGFYRSQALLQVDTVLTLCSEGNHTAAVLMAGGPAATCRYDSKTVLRATHLLNEVRHLLATAPLVDLAAPREPSLGGSRVIDAARARPPAPVSAAVEQRSRPPQAAAPWSQSQTREDAANWPQAWAQFLPMLSARADALGVTHFEKWDCDEFKGTRDALISLGVVGAGDFPGDPGRGCSMTTFAADGFPKRRGEGNSVRPAALRVSRAGRQFLVELYAPPAVRNQRRRQQGLMVFDDDGSAVPAHTPEAINWSGLRLVHSRDDSTPRPPSRVC